MEPIDSKIDSDLIQSSICKLDELQSLLAKLNDKHLSKKVKILSYATIGQHIRHILEFYQCLLDGIECAEVNYDERKRNIKLETSTKEAWHAIYKIKLQLLEIRNNRMITLAANLSKTEGKPAIIVSSLYREMAYCLEHCVHHQALMKIGLYELDLLHLVDKNYGIASSTLRHMAKIKNKSEAH